MSDNLAESEFSGRMESDPEEHDQNKVVAIRLSGDWISVMPGTLELSFGDDDIADVVFSVERLDGQFEEGKLSDITGLKSLED